MTSVEKIAQLAAAVDEETKARPGAPHTHPEFDRLVRTIWRLRQEDGCPWDKEQTHQSISKNMIEEAYEAVEAIAEGSPEHLEEELGDVLEQVVLHSQIEADSGADNRAAGFDIDDVCRALNQKLVRRHPHVFGPEAGSTSSAAAVLDVWESVKAEERASAEDTVHTEGLLDSVPQSLPALMQAQKISKRAAKMGFEWASVNDVWDKVAEERAEFDA
ncbi:MAG: MazG family protein, partial [Atopobium sp.]|nr:MazG family protein [Atopobium sp.]